MSRARQRYSPLAVGIDVGGTWIRAVIVRDGRDTRRVKRVSRVPELTKFLPSVLTPQRRVHSLVVAARGVWTSAERAALRRRLRRLAEHVEVISDAEAALLGALGGRPGLLVLAGTGSIILGRDGRGRLARAGGLGPLIGDEGSAFWLGREWLRLSPEAARRRPHLRPPARRGRPHRRPRAWCPQARAPRPPSRTRDRGRRAGASGGAGGRREPARLGLARPVPRFVEWRASGRRLVPGRSEAGARPPRALPLAAAGGRRRGRRGPPRRRPAEVTMARRLAITVCYREPGVVVLPVERR